MKWNSAGRMRQGQTFSVHKQLHQRMINNILCSAMQTVEDFPSPILCAAVYYILYYRCLSYRLYRREYDDIEGSYEAIAFRFLFLNNCNTYIPVSDIHIYLEIPNQADL